MPPASGSLFSGKIRHVELLGYPGKLKWTHADDGLRIRMPERKPGDHAVVFKIA